MLGEVKRGKGQPALQRDPGRTHLICTVRIAILGFIVIRASICTGSPRAYRFFGTCLIVGAHQFFVNPYKFVLQRRVKTGMIRPCKSRIVRSLGVRGLRLLWSLEPSFVLARAPFAPAWRRYAPRLSTPALHSRTHPACPSNI